MPVLLILLAAALAAAQTPLSPIAGLDQPRNYRMQRSSSSNPDWRNSNDDRIPVAPGQTVTIAELAGPGRIVHIWFTVASAQPSFPRLLVMRIYWDGEQDPSVEAPLGDFFAGGHGMEVDVNSLPIRVTSEGRARNSYWPMPFHKSARITITNDGKLPIRSLYYQVDWEKLPSLEGEAPHFHARYKQEFPARAGNYVILEAQGKGHYVGTIMSVHARTNGWIGEGDDFFFVDGEAEPSLRGTGTEDYVGDAWGFRRFDGPYYGVPIWEGRQSEDLTTYYRFHVPDPVPFTRSIRVEIEHRGPIAPPENSKYGERGDDYASVALWYQTEPHKPFGAIPPAATRLHYNLDNLIDGATLLAAVAAQGGKILKSAAAVVFAAEGPGATLDLPFEVAREGNYELAAYLTYGPGGGRFRYMLDGQPLETRHTDLYQATTYAPAARRLATTRLSAGKHSLRLECTGKNASSSGHTAAVRGLVLVEKPSER